MKMSSVGLSRQRWSYVAGMTVTGNAFRQEHFDLVDFQSHFQASQVKPEVLLTELNGYFAVISKENSIHYAAVDHVRSKPLFYTFDNQECFVSDTPESLRDLAVEKELDQIVEKEFLLTGYVTGRDTLYPGVYQIPAGHFLEVDTRDPSQIKPKLKEYGTWWPNFGAPLSLERDLNGELENIFEDTIKRLISFANGRTIVIPLSGGYDSRIIATLLRKFKYEKIISFTYGIPGNREALISEAVARQLDIQWQFIMYSETKWREWAQSESGVEYFRYMHADTSVPPIQDAFAIHELITNKLIPEDSVVVPGHTGDFIAGGHILKTRNNINSVTDVLIAKHYSLWPLSILGTTRPELAKRISSHPSFNHPDKNSSFGNLNFADAWNYLERQAKFIVNSCRTYDFYGLDWWLPLWDKGFINFWSTVPYEYRSDCKLYREYVKNTCIEVAGTFIEISRPNERKFVAIRFLKRHLKKTLNTRILYRLRRRIYPINSSSHPLAWYGLVNINHLEKFGKHHANINSFLALSHLASVRPDSKLLNKFFSNGGV